MTARFLAAVLASVAGCGSEPATAPIADAEIDTAVVADSEVDSSAADTTTTTDTMTTETPAPDGGAFVRIVHGLDGAAIYLCEDGARLGTSYDRTGAGGAIASGYLETMKLGSRRVHAQATTSAACAAASSTDPTYSLAKGEHKTLFVRALSGSNSILAIADDLTAPAAGKSRVRFYQGATAFASTHGLLDVCVGGAAWAPGLAGALAGPYQEVTPGAASVELRKAAMPACSGAVLGTVAITSVANATHTMFLVDGRGAGAKTHATFCTDANAGVPVKTAACTDTAF